MPSISPAAFLAVDLGSSSGRVMLGILDTDAATPTLVITEAARFSNVPVHTEAGLGWDVPSLWDGVVAGLRAGVAHVSECGLVVAGIGVASWGVDYGRITAAGALRPFVRHHRDVDPQLAAATSARRDASVDYAQTGVLDLAINTVHQLRQDAATGVGAVDDRILLIADIFVRLLTGAEVAEASLASSTGLVDRATGDWSPVLAKGLPAILPRIVPAGALAGHTLPEVTALLGADSPIPVWSVTAHDTAAAFAAVVDAHCGCGTAVVCTGSWAVVGVALDKPVLTETAREAGFTQEIGAGGETLLVKNLSGMWLLQQATREFAAADGLGDWSIDELRALLDQARASAYAGVFDPADPTLQLAGTLVNRLEDACVKAGFARPATRADLVRTILQSLAAAYELAIQQLEAITGLPVTDVRVVGGGARNELLCTLTARRSGRATTVGPAEASVRGLLFQLAVAAGYLPDLPTARRIRVDDGEPAGRRFVLGPTSSEESAA